MEVAVRLEDEDEGAGLALRREDGGMVLLVLLKWSGGVKGRIVERV